MKNPKPPANVAEPDKTPKPANDEKPDKQPQPANDEEPDKSPKPVSDANPSQKTKLDNDPEPIKDPKLASEEPFEDSLANSTLEELFNGTSIDTISESDTQLGTQKHCVNDV